MNHPLIYIIILNWNGWEDTIECLESVFRNDYPNYRVIVCDNASQDDSIEKIKEWAEGKRTAISKNKSISSYTTPPLKKPILYIEYNRSEAEAGGKSEDRSVPLVLIQTGANLGFAGGNNVGLRYALTRKDFQYVWLLNNDTVIHPHALTAMVQRLQQNHQGGICGSTLLYYNEPSKVQALGGATYNQWLGIAKHINEGQTYDPEKINSARIERKMAYVVGASMLVTKTFLDQIGLLCEDYFLYFEELDWSMRAKRKFALVYALDSIVYHKEGSSIGSNKNPKFKSFLSDFYGIKNRIAFTKRFFPHALPTVYVGLIVTLINRIRRNQYDRVNMVLKIMVNGLRGKM